MSEVLRLMGPTGLRLQPRTGWVWAFCNGVPVIGCHFRSFLGQLPNSRVIEACQEWVLFTVSKRWSPRTAELLRQIDLKVDPDE